VSCSASRCDYILLEWAKPDLDNDDGGDDDDKYSGSDDNNEGDSDSVGDYGHDDIDVTSPVSSLVNIVASMNWPNWSSFRWLPWSKACMDWCLGLSQCSQKP